MIAKHAGKKSDAAVEEDVDDGMGLCLGFSQDDEDSPQRSRRASLDGESLRYKRMRALADSL